MAASQPRAHVWRCIPAVALFLLALVVAPSLYATARRASDPLRFAVEQVQARGAYSYDARVETTVTPDPRIENVGLSPQRQSLALRGQLDLRRETLDLSILQGDGGFATGGAITIRVADGIAQARSGDGAWQPLELPAGAFTPTSNFLGLLGAARDRSPAALVRLGDRELARYTFAIDGYAFASQMRDELERTLSQQNRLVPGMSVESLAAYRDATGTGELLVDGAGLPVRQIIHLTIPDAQHGQTVSGVITVDFAGFAPAPALGQPLQWAIAVAWDQLALSLALLLVVAILLLGLVRARRTRPLYLAITLFVLVSMLTSPLLQAGRLSVLAAESQARPAVASQAEGAAAPVAPAAEAARAESRAAAFALAQGLAAGSDADQDGLTDAVEAQVGSNPALADSDGDGLSDGVEVLELGTRPADFDTDGDGLGDGLEVQPLVGPDGVTRYLDPFQADTNRDSLHDFAECATDGYCPDGDGDKLPDAWDDDNDGDGVPDWLDSAPNSAVSGGNGPGGTLLGVPGGAFALNVDGYNAGLPVLVDFTLRPTNPARLWYHSSVLDWPSDDRAGQIKRVFDTTLGSEGNLADGDMRLVPMLEITIPYAAGAFGGLPVKSSYAGADLPSLAGVDLKDSQATAAWFATWLDQPQLDGYQITVRIGEVTNGKPSLVVYLPLDLLRDSEGGAAVAFTGRMFYLPKAAIADHTVRLAWSVQMQTDRCKPTPAADSGAGESFNQSRWNRLPAEQKAGLKYQAWEKLSGSERSRIWCEDNGNWERNENPSVVQTYYDDFYLSALDVSEERGIRVAAVVEEPQPDTQPLLQHRLWNLARNLDRTFVAGRDCDSVSAGACVGNGSRDLTVAEIQRRFDSPTNDAVSLVERWNIDDVLRVRSFDFADPGQMSRLFFGHSIGGSRYSPLLNTWLNDVYAPNRSTTATLASPTVLVARERTFRSAGLATAKINTGRMSISLSDVLPTTQAGLSWQSFEYQTFGVWKDVNTSQYYDNLGATLGSTLAGAAGPTAATPEAAVGSVRLLQGFYLSMLNGRTQLVALDNRALAPSAPEQADAAIAAPAGARATLAAFAEAMAGLVVSNQAHRGLLAPTGVGELLDAIGRQVRYRDGGPSLSLLQGLGYLRGAQSTGATLSNAMIGVAATIAQPEVEPEIISTEIKRGSEIFMAGYDIITSVADIYSNLKVATNFAKSASALKSLKDVFEGVQKIYNAQTAASVTGKVLGTVSHALREAGKFAVIITIVVELIVFAAKLIALIKAGNATFLNVLDLVMESLVSLAVSLIMMAVIAAIVPIGTFIAGVIALIDLAAKGICMLTGWDESDSILAQGFCEGIMGNITKALMFVLYDKTPLVDMEEAGRLNPTNWELRPYNPDTMATTGFIAGSDLFIKSDVVTTLDIKNYALYRSVGIYDASDLNKATFRYQFTAAEETDDERIHVRLGVDTRQMNNLWRRVGVPWGFDQQVYTATVTTTRTLDRAGLNWKPENLYLAEGYATPAILCVVLICVPRTETGSNYINLADSFVLDIFPPTLDGFRSLTDDDGDGGFRLAWDERFPDLADADADGLRSAARGGNDPGDNSPDSDQDGLSDLYELKHADRGLNPRDADTDDDGLNDLAEIRLGLNPAVADGDVDGLKDGEEIAGWEIVYGYDAEDKPLRFRTGSDPFDADTDDDGLLDKREQIYGFNPRVFNAADLIQIQSELVEGDGRADGIVAAGATVGFTAAVTSTLRDRFALGLFEADLQGVAPSPDLAPSGFRLFPQGRATLGGSLTLPPGVPTQATLLTRAGAIIADLQGISGGRTLWLPFDESAGPRFADASPFAHDATCAGTCAQSAAAAYSGRALLLVPTRAPLRVASAPSLAAERFTLTAWVNPTLKGKSNAYNPPAVLSPTTLVARRDAAGTDYALDLAWSRTSMGNPPIIPPAFEPRPRLSLRGAACGATVSLEATRTLPQGRWSQVAAVYDGTQLRLYINGVAAGSLSHADGLCRRDVPLEIGQSLNTATSEIESEQTRLDEIALYPYPMSLAEVQALFRDPVLRLGFNGNTVDSSNLRQSTATRGAGDLTLAASRDGDLVGVFDKKRWLEIGPSSSLDMSQGPGQFTLAAFVRPVPLSPDSGWQGVLGRENGLSTYPSLFVNHTGQLMVKFGTGSALCDSGATPALLTPGAWGHVAVSYTGTQFVFYIDGVERARQAIGGCPAGSRPTGDQLFVGRTSSEATLTLNTLVVADEGDGIGDAEYFMHWGGTRIWARNAISAASYIFDSHFVPGWSKNLTIASDAGTRLELFEDDDYFDDTLLDRQVQPFEVNDAGSWSYDDDGQGVLNWRLWNSWFNGDLDEVQIYRVALDPADARALYNRLNNQSYALHARLEEPPTTTVFRDGSGNLLTGLCSGAGCPTTGLPGRDGQAARFKDDDSIVIADRPALDLAESFTVSAWVNLDSPADNQKIAGKFDLDKGGYMLGVENGQIYGELRDASGNTRVVRGGSVPAGAWTHLAISASAGQYLVGYVNGLEVGRTALPQTTRADAAAALPAPGSATLYLDPNYESEIQTFSGDVADLDDNNDASSIRVANLCLRLYDGSNYSDASRLICDSLPKLTGFDEMANSARVYTTPPAYDTSVQALRLQSGGYQHLRIDPAAVGNPIFSTVSIAAWVRPSNPRPAEMQALVTRGSDGGAEGFRLNLNPDGRLAFEAGNGSWTSADSIPGGVGWTHVAVTLDGAAVRFYINGVESGARSFVGNVNDVGGPILVGRMPRCGSKSSCNFFDGHLRDLAIFTRALSAAEVLGLRGSAEGNASGNAEASGAAPNGRVVFLPFDGGGVGAGGRTFQTLVADAIGVNDAPFTIGRATWAQSYFVDGLIDEVAVLEYAADQAGVAELMNAAPRLRLALDEPVGLASFADTASATTADCAGLACPQAGARGRIREAPVFGAAADGADDMLSVPDAARLDLSRFSLELWVRPEAVRPGEQVLVAKARNGGDMANYILSLAPGSLRLRLVTAGGSLESARALSQGQWSHVVATYDGAQLRLFINGTAEPAAGAGAPALNDAPLRLGALPGRGVGFNGALDELSIYGRALGAEEVSAHYLYQESWYDNVDRVNLTIDQDAPTAALSIADNTVIAAEPLLVGVAAADPTSEVAAVLYDDDGDALADDWKPALPGADGNGWFFTFTPPAPGSYPLRAYATDLFGHTSPVAVATVRVDGAAPVVAPSSALTTANLRPVSGAEAGVWLLPLGGVADDALSAPVTVIASITGPDGLVGSELVVEAKDGAWSGNYRFLFPPNGIYTLQLSAEDAVGNRVQAAPVALALDAHAPVADVTIGGSAIGNPSAGGMKGVLMRPTVAGVAATTALPPVLAGAIIDAPRPANPLLLTHFEEQAGAAAFLDSSFAQRRVACAAPACPAAGGPGRVGRALAFDGQDDTLRLDGLGSGDGDFAVALWLRPTGGAAQVPLFATGAGAPILELRADGSRLGVYARAGGALTLVGETSLAPATWSHVAVSFDGAELRAFGNGALFASLAVADLPAFDTLWVGSRGGGSFFQGGVDELAVYGAALSDEMARLLTAPIDSGVMSLELSLTHIKDLENPGAALRQAATLAPSVGGIGAWSAPVPQGIEGPYLLNLASADRLGNSWSQPNVWSGEIDTRAPRVTLFRRELGDGTALVSCVVEDYNLDAARITCPVPQDQWSFAGETAAWYQEFYGATMRQVRMSTPLVRIASPADRIEACDSFGNCASASSSSAAPGVRGVSLIVAPGDSQLFTTRDPITVRGYAYAEDGLRSLSVQAGGASFYGPAVSGAELLWASSFTPATDGVYALQATATGADGTSYTDPNAPTITVDTAAPVVAITSLQLVDAQAGTLALTGKVTETVGLTALQARVDGGSWVDLSLPAAGQGVNLNATLALAQAGPYDGVSVSVELRATDVAGRTATTSRNVVLDTVAPVLTITGLTLVDEAAGTLALTGKVTETVGLTALQARVDGGSWLDLSLPAAGQGVNLSAELTLAQAGPYDGLSVSVELRATDKDGNTATTSRSLVLDTVAPVLAITGLTLADEAVGTLALTGKVTETVGLTALQARVDGGSWLDLSLPAAGQGVNLNATLALAQAGPYDGVSVSVELRATDKDGNTGTTSRNVVLDTVAPVLAITGLTLADEAAGTLALTGKVTETVGLTALQARVDGGSWLDLSLPAAGQGVNLNATLALAQAGPYDGLSVSVELRATDKDGNTGTTSRSLVLDTVAPVLSIDSLALADAQTGTLALTGRVTETVGLTALQARVDGGSWVTLSLPAAGQGVNLNATLALAQAGPYDGVSVSVELRATDKDGNTATTSRSLVLDTVAPVLAITGLTLADEAAGTLALTGKVTETVGLTALQARVDGGSWVTLSLPAAGQGVNLNATLALAQAGPYDGVSVSVELRATDKDGNTATTSRSLVLDTVAPVLSIDSLALADAQTGTLALTGRVTETVGLTALQARVDGGAWQDLALVAAGAGVDLRGTLALAQAGPYDGLSVSVELRATDKDGNTGTTSRNVVLDTVAPIVSIDGLALADPAAGTLALSGRITETLTLARVEVQIDGGAWTELPLPGSADGVVQTTLALGSPAPYDGLSVLVRLRATDKDGNTGTTSRSLVLDTVAPVLAITGLTLADEATGTLALTGKVTETVGLTTLQARVDGGSWLDLSLPAAGQGVNLSAELTLAQAGPYDGLSVSVELRATDKDGNTATTSRSLVLDTTAPKLTALVTQHALGKTLVVVGSADDGVAVASVTVTVTSPSGQAIELGVPLGAPWQGHAQPWRFESSAPLHEAGDYKVMVAALDTAGNRSQRELAFTLKRPVYRFYLPIIRK